MSTKISVEERIAARAVDALHAKSGLRLEMTDKNTVLGTGLWPDMCFAISGSELELVCEVKNGLSRNMLEPVVKLLKSAAEGRPPMIMTNYIDAKLGKALRDLGVNYVDASGNAYINLSPYFVFIEGQLIADGLTQIKPAKPFSATDLQVIYALLTKPELLNENYRTVAQCANVAMGVCGSVLRELKDQGFFVETIASNATGVSSVKQREWRARHQLIGRWVEQYSTLSKRTYLGEYSSPDLAWLESTEFVDFDAQIGGQAAVSRYANEVEMNVDGVSVYINDQQQWQFIRQMGLSKEASEASQHNSVKVYSKFWGDDHDAKSAGQPKMVHPLMAYAELIEQGGEAGRLAANQIASRYFV